MKSTFRVMVSSTTKDLIDHRKIAIDKINRRQMIPLVMETLGATPHDPITDSLKLVEQSDIYVLIMGRRYGSIPEDTERNPDRISITEMEYQHARKLELPIYIFVMSDDHPITQTNAESRQTESVEHQEKLTKFKHEVMHWTHTVDIFSSPDNFGSRLGDALTKFQIEHQETLTVEGAERLTSIPNPPKLFAAPPYTIDKFVGRQNEKSILDNWLYASDDPILVLRAIGGQGKSALMWDWVNNVDREKYKGAIWWNFDKGNAFHQDGQHVHTFLCYAIAYMRNDDPNSLFDENFPQLLEQFTLLLQREPYLLVLDGIERILHAYNRLDANHVPDEFFVDDEALRACISPHEHAFLQRLIQCQPSKILIGTRLYPNALEDEIGNCLDGIQLLQLRGLNDNDAWELMQKLGVRFADKEKLTQFIKQLGNHGLMLRLAARHIARYRRAPGDFDSWFNVYGLRLWQENASQQRDQLLSFAIDGMDEEKVRFFEDISAFRGTMTQEMIELFNPYLPPKPAITELLNIPPIRQSAFCDEDATDDYVSENEQKRIIQKRQKQLQTFDDAYESSNEWIQAQAKFDMLLTELEDRGLLEWNRDDWTYDLHPVVRSYAHDLIEGERRTEVFRKQQNYLSERLASRSEKDVKTTADLDEEIELFYAFINMNEVDAAVGYFFSNLFDPLISRLNDSAKTYQLLQPLVENHLNDLDSKNTGKVLLWYAITIEALGHIEAAANYVSAAIPEQIKENMPMNVVSSLVVYARHILAQNKLADVEYILQIAEELANVSGAKRYLTWVQESQIEFYALIGDIERSNEIKRSTVLDRTRAADYATDHRSFLITMAYINLARGESAQAEIEQIENYLALKWQHGVERILHYLRGWQAYLNSDFKSAEASLIKNIRMSSEAQRSTAISMSLLGVVWQKIGKTSNASRVVKETLKQKNITQYDRARMHYYLALNHYIGGEKAQTINHIEQAWHFAIADGSPYIHAQIVDDLKQLASQVEITLPELPNYDVQPISIPYEADIRNYIEEIRSGAVIKRGGGIAPSKFEWKKVTDFQVCAVCTFGLDMEEDDRVWEITLEMHGLSSRIYDLARFVYEDDSTEIVSLEPPIQQIRASEARALNVHSDLLHDTGCIVLLCGEDDEGDIYAFMYCLGEEILNFASASYKGEPINPSQYFVKPLYEGRGTCIDPRHQADIFSAYKIDSKHLTLIIA